MDQVAVRRTRRFVQKHYPHDTITLPDGSKATINFPTPKPVRIDYDLDEDGERLLDAVVYALDTSTGALAVVSLNAQRHGVADRVCCLKGDLLKPLPEVVDVLVANLPYVTTAEWEALPPEIRAYEPRPALDGGSDGLTFIRRLFADACHYVRPGGAILVEIGAGQGKAVADLARGTCPEAHVDLWKDYAGLDRLVVARGAPAEVS
jgi:release factor glutamine methyltransferase